MSNGERKQPGKRTQTQQECNLPEKAAGLRRRVEWGVESPWWPLGSPMSMVTATPVSGGARAAGVPSWLREASLRQQRTVRQSVYESVGRRGLQHGYPAGCWRTRGSQSQFDIAMLCIPLLLIADGQRSCRPLLPGCNTGVCQILRRSDSTACDLTCSPGHCMRLRSCKPLLTARNVWLFGLL